MQADAEKIVASGLATVSVTFMALWVVLPGWALQPPRLGLSSAFLAPLGHLGFRGGLPEPIVLGLTVGPFLALGSYLGRSWVRGTLCRALAVSALVYALAVLAALGTGVDRS
jgi:hypothetical protein